MNVVGGLVTATMLLSAAAARADGCGCWTTVVDLKYNETLFFVSLPFDGGDQFQCGHNNHPFTNFVLREWLEADKYGYAPSDGSGGVCLHHATIRDAQKWLNRTKADFERSGMPGYVVKNWTGYPR